MRGPQSQWCAELRFRKGLALVSRLWWEPAIRGLYEHIVIRRFGQISALARTLSSQEAGIDFSALVRRITLHQCAFFWPCVDVACEDLRSILERCVALEEFSFRGHPECDNAYSDEHKAQPLPQSCFNPIWLFPQTIFPALHARGPTALRKLDVLELDCWQPPVVTALLNLVAASPRITTLAIRNFNLPANFGLPTLEFLEDLWVNFDFQHFSPVSASSSRAMWKWDLPKLRSLTIFQDEALPTMLETLGRSLTYLHIASDVPSFGDDFGRLSQLCPVLEHFAFYPPYPLRQGGAGALFRGRVEPFRRLRHVDLWFRDELDPVLWHPDAAAAELRDMRAKFAPVLESVRGLIWYPTDPPVHDDLPKICHPSGIAHAGDSRFVCLRGVWMVQTDWCVRPLGDWWLGEDMWLEDDSEDYELSDGEGADGSDEDGTSSWTSELGSGSSVESEPGEGSHEEDVESNLLLRRDEDGCQSKGKQMSRENILEGFGRVQEGCDILVERVQSAPDGDVS